MHVYPLHPIPSFLGYDVDPLLKKELFTMETRVFFVCFPQKIPTKKNVANWSRDFLYIYIYIIYIYIYMYIHPQNTGKQNSPRTRPQAEFPRCVKPLLSSAWLEIRTSAHC